MALNYNTDGMLKTQLSLGPDYDYYRMYLSVNIVDDFNGITTFTLPNPVNVTADTAATNNLISSLVSSDPSSGFLKTLQSGDLNTVAKNVIALASTLNSLVDDDSSSSSSSSNSSSSSSDSSGSSSSGSSGSSASSGTASSATNSAAQQQKNQKAEARAALMNFVSQMPVTSPSSAKVLSSTISVLTRKTSEISMGTAVIYFDI
jgi:hypothetical protein